jgi:hypothetical protein
MTSQDAERQELERAIELMGRSTRPGRLLEYLGAKYFQQQEAHLTEFTIATEVFGRSAKNFDPTSDAVVRVEAHRLRKKLKEIYERGQAPGLQISLPAGTYVPKFTAAASATAANAAADGEAGTAEPVGLARIPLRSWSLVLGAVLAVIVVVIATNKPAPGIQAGAADTPPPVPASAATGVSGAITELHMMAGHSGGEVIDNSGVRWTPDRYFVGGGNWSRDSGFIRGTSRPFLFEKWRTGEFGYDLPMAPGTYEMRLFFLSAQRVGDEKLAGFHIALNGQPLVDTYDVIMSAKGADVADELVFRDVAPGADGLVRLWFTNRTGSPFFNAIELVPGTPGKLNPIRITMQPTSFVDHQGQRWRADDYYQNGFRSIERRKVSGTDDPELFGAERFGHFSYAIPVDRRGRYTVILHFAEFYYGPQLPGAGGAGSRLFHVFCNGRTLLENYDIYKEAGSLRVVTKTFTNIPASALGKINLTFEPVVNNATISGIEILEEPG